MSTWEHYDDLSERSFTEWINEHPLHGNDGNEDPDPYEDVELDKEPLTDEDIPF